MFDLLIAGDTTNTNLLGFTVFIAAVVIVILLILFFVRRNKKDKE